MTIPRERHPKPVPHAPTTHKRHWRSLWRRCACGLPAPCADRLASSPSNRATPGRHARTHPPTPTGWFACAGRATNTTQASHPRSPAGWSAGTGRPVNTTGVVRPPSPTGRLGGTSHPANPTGWFAGTEASNLAYNASRATSTANAIRAASAPRQNVATDPIAASSETRSAGLATVVGTTARGRAARPITPRGVAWPIDTTTNVSPTNLASQVDTANPARAARPPAATNPANPTGHTNPTSTASPGSATDFRDLRSDDRQFGAPGWMAPTAFLSQVGRAGDLTPAQAFRAGQGRTW